MATRCPGCGLVLPATDTGGHAYLGASPACWAVYGEVLAREYGDPAYMAVHRLTVDAYCAQHPGKSGRRTIQSINVHLVGLHLTIDQAADPAYTRKVMARLNADPASLAWLPPPAALGLLTVVEVHAAANAAAHRASVTAWAASVWNAWRDHRPTIVALARSAA